jgi:cytochrome c peroxidase
MNGLLPPDYKATEYEILGVPATDDLTHPKKDKDSGRYNKFPTGYYIGAFKTPTLRNIAETGPYMHNGKFKSLASVLEFYNRGGGQGLGLDVPNQTLSSEPLHLTYKEKQQIILFLKALSDSTVRNGSKKG